MTSNSHTLPHAPSLGWWGELSICPNQYPAQGIEMQPGAHGQANVQAYCQRMGRGWGVKGRETTSQSETFSSTATVGVPHFQKCLPVPHRLKCPELLLPSSPWKVIGRLVRIGDLHSGSKIGNFIVTLIQLRSILWLRAYRRAPSKIHLSGVKKNSLTDIQNYSIQYLHFDKNNIAKKYHSICLFQNKNI